MVVNFTAEDYVAVLNALSPPVKQRRPRGPRVRIFESGIPPEGSDLFVPILETLARASISEPKQRIAMAYAVRMQRPEDESDDEELQRTGKNFVFHSTLFVSQTSALEPTADSASSNLAKARKTQEFLEEIWSCMKGISQCLEDRKPITQLAHQPSWPQGATGERVYLKLRDRVRELQRKVFAKGFLKIRRRIMKRWELFDNFVDHVRKDETIDKNIRNQLVKVRNALINPVATFKTVKDPKPSKKVGGSGKKGKDEKKEKPLLPLAVLNDLNDSLVFCERIYRREPIPEAAVEALNKSVQSFLPQYRKRHPNAKFDDSNALDVKRYIETLFAHSDACRVLENIAYSWRYVPLFHGHMSAVVIPEDAREINLPLPENGVRTLLKSCLSEKSDVNLDEYVSKLRRNGYFIQRGETEGRKRTRVHYECSLVAYVHRRFRNDDTIRRWQTRDPTYEPSPYPFIGVSKPSCTLCKAYIDRYNALMWPTCPGGVFRSYAKSSPHPLPSEVLSCAVDGLWLSPRLREERMDAGVNDTLVKILRENISKVEIEASIEEDEHSKWRDEVRYLSVPGRGGQGNTTSRPVSVSVSTLYSSNGTEADSVDARRRVSTSGASFREKMKGFMGMTRRSSR